MKTDPTLSKYETTDLLPKISDYHKSAQHLKSSKHEVMESSYIYSKPNEFIESSTNYVRSKFIEAGGRSFQYRPHNMRCKLYSEHTFLALKNELNIQKSNALPKFSDKPRISGLYNPKPRINDRSNYYHSSYRIKGKDYNDISTHKPRISGRYKKNVTSLHKPRISGSKTTYNNCRPRISGPWKSTRYNCKDYSTDFNHHAQRLSHQNHSLSHNEPSSQHPVYGKRTLMITIDNRLVDTWLNYIHQKCILKTLEILFYFCCTLCILLNHYSTILPIKLFKPDAKTTHDKTKFDAFLMKQYIKYYALMVVSIFKSACNFLMNKLDVMSSFLLCSFAYLSIVAMAILTESKVNITCNSRDVQMRTILSILCKIISCEISTMLTTSSKPALSMCLVILNHTKNYGEASEKEPYCIVLGFFNDMLEDTKQLYLTIVILEDKHSCLSLYIDYWGKLLYTKIAY